MCCTVLSGAEVSVAEVSGAERPVSQKKSLFLYQYFIWTSNIFGMKHLNATQKQASSLVYSLKTAIFALLALFAYNISTAQQSSPIADTTWGTGFFVTFDEDGNNIPNSTLEVKALDMEMIVPNKI